MRKAVILGIASSFFFAFTFVLNRQMNLTGGHWIWSASLRYAFMLPILLVITALRGELAPVLRSFRSRPGPWILWSTVGFGLFYAPLSFAAGFGPSWLIAGTWQITIIAGALLTPLFHKAIPVKALLFSAVILLGIFIMQAQQISRLSAGSTVTGVLLVTVAAFAYPLGNRKMMELYSDELNSVQRVFGMTLGSMPFWILLAAAGAPSIGFPGGSQLLQSFLVAICSGVIATLLFFKATSLVQHHPHRLAVVESTQAGEVVFTLLGGIFIFSDRIPDPLSILGIVLVIAGMTMNSLSAQKK